MGGNDNAADSKDVERILSEAKKQFNTLFSNMFRFEDSDMELYDKCYADVFGNGPEMSYMSATFFAQFAPEILFGLLSSSALRRFISVAIENEKGRHPDYMPEWWAEGMEEKRFGIAGRDYTEEMADLTEMMHVSYNKIAAMNQLYGTSAGKKDFEMYCLSREAVDCIKAIILEFPYLIRRYDYDKAFADAIMEYAGIIYSQMREAAAEAGA